MRNFFYKLPFLFFLLLGTTNALHAQTDTIPVLDYSDPRDFEIGGIVVKGAEFSDDNALISVAGLKVGDKIRVPGTEIPKAIKKLWKLRLFTNVQIYKEKTIGEIIFLEISVKERPRLTVHSYKGVNR